MTTLRITVVTELSQHYFDLDTDIDIETPFHEFVDRIDLIAQLDRDYPGWTYYDIDLYEIPKREWEKTLEEKLNEQAMADFDSE